MTKKTLISVAIGALLSSAMGAAMADDLDVFKPKEGDQATASNPIVYFAYQADAEGYMVDLVGPNSAANTCDGAVAFQGYITRKGSDCTTTAGPADKNPDVDGGDSSGTFNDKVRVCQWNAPTLQGGANAYYKLSVTGFDVNTKGLMTDATSTTSATKYDSLLRDNDCAAASGTAGKYQTFKVASATTPPQPSAPKLPVAGVSCKANTGTGASDCKPVIKGTDAAGSVDGSATWVQLWINDKDGFNLTQQWYQIGSGGVTCTLKAGVRTCEFPDISGTLSGKAGPFTWWTRLWNPAGAAPWSAAATMTE